MKKIGAELILASKNSITGDIIYTFLLTFPRMILAEVLTHKLASRNTSSSRAVPVPSMMKRIWNDPFIPYKWGTYQKGMQAGPELTGFKRWLAIRVWRLGRLFDLAEAWFDHHVLHLAKEITNRVYERFMWTEQVFTITDVNNLLLLRNHFAAEPHFQEIAKQIARVVDIINRCFADRYRDKPFAHLASEIGSGMYTRQELTDIWSDCQILKPGEWHLPYTGKWKDVALRMELSDIHSADCVLKTSNVNTCDCSLSLDYWKKVSAGRCAWVSYYVPGDDSKRMDNHRRAIETYEKLAGAQPFHASPLEHQATPLPESVRCGNLCGFLAFRKTIPGEAGGDKVVPSVTPAIAMEMIEKWTKENG